MVMTLLATGNDQYLEFSRQVGGGFPDRGAPPLKQGLDVHVLDEKAALVDLDFEERSEVVRLLL